MAIDGKSVLILFLAVIVMATYFDSRRKTKSDDTFQRQQALVQEIEPEPKTIDEYLEKRRQKRQAA